MRPLSRLLLVSAIVGAAVLGGVAIQPDAGAQTPSAPQAPPPVAVEVAEAVKRDFAPLHWAPGSVVSREDARVASELGGRVVSVAEVGQSVRRGDALARLDEAALRLREQDNVANVERTQAQLDYAIAQESRYEQLAAESSISRAQLEQTRADRRVLEQDLARARVALEEVRHQRRQSTVRAPFDGVVAERFTQLGEYLATGAPVVRLVNTGALEVQARAPVALAAQLSVGAPVSVRVGEITHERPVTAVVPVGDEASRQLELRVALDLPALNVGAAVDVGLPSAEPRAVVAVPRDALVLRGDGAFVMRVNAEAVAERVTVEAGTSQDGLVEVRGAVHAGDLLVVRGGERLQPGQRVEWSPPAEAVAAK